MNVLLKFEVLKDLNLKVFLHIELDIIAGGRKQKDRSYVHFEIEKNLNSFYFKKCTMSGVYPSIHERFLFCRNWIFV